MKRKLTSRSGDLKSAAMKRTTVMIMELKVRRHTSLCAFSSCLSSAFLPSLLAWYPGIAAIEYLKSQFQQLQYLVWKDHQVWAQSCLTLAVQPKDTANFLVRCLSTKRKVYAWKSISMARFSFTYTSFTEMYTTQKSVKSLKQNGIPLRQLFRQPSKGPRDCGPDQSKTWSDGDFGFQT